LVHFPARWHDANFNGVLPKGTPIAQCIPIKREKWASRIETLSTEDAGRLNDTITSVSSELGVYRRDYRARKR
jgi:hypothetical protein